LVPSTFQPRVGTPRVGGPDSSHSHIAADDAGRSRLPPGRLRYDIQVTTSRGKKGLGTEGFQVLDVEAWARWSGEGSRATSINRLGMVVGNASGSDGQGHPFVWTDGVMQKLPTVDGWMYRGANDINDAGVVVGGAYDGVSWLAFRWVARDAMAGTLNRR